MGIICWNCSYPIFRQTHVSIRYMGLFARRAMPNPLIYHDSWANPGEQHSQFPRYFACLVLGWHNPITSQHFAVRKVWRKHWPDIYCCKPFGRLLVSGHESCSSTKVVWLVHVMNVEDDAIVNRGNAGQNARFYEISIGICPTQLVSDKGCIHDLELSYEQTETSDM